MICAKSTLNQSFFNQSTNLFMKTTLFLALMLCQTQFLSAQAPCPPSSSKSIHIVQKGETLYGISRQHKLSLAQLTQWNNIEENSILLPCTTLSLVPITAKSVQRKADDVPQMYGNSAGATAKTRPIPRETSTYGNTDGNTEWALNQNPSLASSTFSAKSANVASPNYSYFNQSAYVPFYHITSDGETRQSIGKMYGLSENDVMQMNNLTSNVGLSGGQKLVLEHRDQRKTQAYALERIDNSSRLQPSAATNAPQSYAQQPQYNAPTTNNGSDVTSANEFGSKPAAPVEQLAAKPTKQPQPQTTQPQVAQPQKPQTQASKPANNAPLSNNTSMSNEEMDMVREINLVRQNPAGYVQYIKEYIAHLQKNGDMGASIQTSHELIGELEKTPKLSTLQPMQCIYTAAKKHGEDQKSRGTTDHSGSDGSMPWDRVLRECPNLKDGNENLVGGPSDIRRAVILLLVDDGIDTRGHRKTLLNPEWQYVACYKMGTVGSMPNCWVQKFGF
jgi:LysM repeat protein